MNGLRIWTFLLAASLPACDLGTDPWDLSLADVSDPPPNHATIVLTADLPDDGGSPGLLAGHQYFFPLRLPPVLPELLYDGDVGTAILRLHLGDASAAGVRWTGTDDVALFLGAPAGELFQPISSCRITISSAWTDEPGSRLQGDSDCPVTDGFRTLRVLVKFDHTS